MTEEEALRAASACRGEYGELTMSVIDEHEASGNNQWRKDSLLS